MAILVCVCVYTDLCRYRIHNKILIPGLLCAMGYRLLTDGVQGLLLGLLSMLIPFFILYPVFCIRAFGAGDIKLMCVVACYMTPKQTCLFILASFLAGAVLSVIKMIRHKNILKRFKYFFFYLKNCFQTKRIKAYKNEWKESREQRESVIHFSIPIAISTFLWIGGYL